MNETNWLQWALGGASAALTGIFGWMTNRVVNRQDQHDERIRALESTVATHDDITGVYGRLNTISDQMNANHQAVMSAVIERRNER